jgi:hypothetical protein
MNDDLQRIYKEVSMEHIKVVSQYMPGVTEENYKNRQSE